MKRTVFIGLMFVAIAGIATAQITKPSTDVLGAHLNYGRGCTACHSPHSGASGNGNARIGRSARRADTLSGAKMSAACTERPSPPAAASSSRCCRPAYRPPRPM